LCALPALRRGVRVCTTFRTSLGGSPHRNSVTATPYAERKDRLPILYSAFRFCQWVAFTDCVGAEAGQASSAEVGEYAKYWEKSLRRWYSPALFVGCRRVGGAAALSERGWDVAAIDLPLASPRKREQPRSAAPRLGCC
jgi:hypothetical protein